MATDATGAPTPLGIPKYNTSADAPSGLGFNAAMDTLDALITARVKMTGSPLDNDVPVYDAAFGTWRPSSFSLAKKLPGTILDQIDLTGAVSVTATTEATATTIVTSSAITYDGATAVDIEFRAPDVVVAANAAGNGLVFVLYEDGASIGFLTQLATGGTTFLEGPVNVGRRKAPTAGSHTYSVRAYRSNANCTVQGGGGGAGTFVPGYLRIKKAA